MSECAFRSICGTLATSCNTRIDVWGQLSDGAQHTCVTTVTRWQRASQQEPAQTPRQTFRLSPSRPRQQQIHNILQDFV